MKGRKQMALNEIGAVVSDVAQTPHQRVPTLWELAEQYPRFVVGVIANPEEPQKSMAELKVPYAGDTLRLLRSTPGAHWNPERKVWRVPAYASGRLSEILYVIATRSH
jgi:hypothetical protein